jgi:acetyl-CoA C-acetyltransferase
VSRGLFQRFEDVFVLDGLRTPMVDYLGAFADANPIDLGIKAAKAVLARSGADPARVDSVLAGNMAPGAQTLAVARDLGLDLARLNVKGGAIALGHPLAATGVRLTITVARQLQDIGARWGVASACIGGGQGIALLVENPQTR